MRITTPPAGHTCWTAVLGAALLLLAAPAARGQQAEPAAGTVSGTILDAATGEPLADALVALEPAPGGLVPTRDRRWATHLSMRTNERGAYRFGGLGPGEYRLTVRLLGFRPASVDVDLRRAPSLQLSVGLALQPIRLEREIVSARPIPAFASARRAGDARLDVVAYRQERFLESDARAVTEDDLAEAVTLGETDLFRALHRLPGVTTRDDFTSALWTRGAPWSHTRVYYDGLPLFNPVHAAGVLSGVNPDAVGGAFFHPGVRSAAIGEGAAGVLDLTSRRWTGPRFGGAAGLSVASARLALGAPLAEGTGGWSVAARRSHIDLLSHIVTDSAGRIPYAFLDLAGRLDAPLLGGARLEASTLWERDDVWGTVPDLLSNNRGHWGNVLGQVTVGMRHGSLYGRHSVGVSRFGAAVQSALFVADSSLRQAVPTHQPISNVIAHFALRSRLEPLAAGRRRHWSAGSELVVQQQEFTGPLPRPYPELLFHDTLQLALRNVRLALWGEGRWSGERVAVQAGLRAELPGDVANVGTLALAPRLSVRIAATPWITLSAAYGRSYQYTQAVAPAGPGIGPDLYISDVWLMARDTIPAIRSDVATIGAEAWLSTTWLASATLYGRIATGVAVPDPTPGQTGPHRPLFVPAVNRAAGVEVSLRRLAGPVTLAASYTYGGSQLEALDLVYPAPSARRHVLDGVVTARLGSAIRLGGAVTAASGAHFTRFLRDAVPCSGSDTITCPDTLLITTRAIEEPGAGLAPAYVTFSLMAEWTRRFSTWELAVTLQVLNILNRRNAVTYVGSEEPCSTPVPTSQMPRAGVCDLFDRGLPLLPLVGVRARF